MPRKKQTTVIEVVDQVRNGSEAAPVEKESAVRCCFPTGSTLLNLAVSDNAFGGWGSGKVINLVGDSNTGKTLLALCGAMEITQYEDFDDVEPVYDDAEHALEMDIEAMFGPRLCERLRDPYGHKYGDPNWAASDTIDGAKNALLKILRGGRRFFYIMDSYDALTSAEELARQKKAEEIQQKIDKLVEEGKEAEANKIKTLNRDYPRGPAVLSEMLRKCKAPLKRTGSNVMIISQTRDVMDPIAFAAQKRRAGGNALKFYASHEVWLAVAQNGKIKRTVDGTPYTIGWNIQMKSVRSKLTGKTRTVPMTCFTDYGVDDIGANVDWLMAHKVWTGTKAVIQTKGFKPGAIGRDDLIQYVERNNKEDKLREVVQTAWDSIEARLKLDRKRRFE